MSRILRIGYVREHFACPLLQYAENDGGKSFTLVECPGGTGQLIAALANDEVDLVIALTDGLIAGIAKGSEYRLVGSYVTSPLNWAVVTGKNSSYQSIRDLHGTTIGISRRGSGSELMAKLMALQQGWKPEELEFKVCNNLAALKEAVNDGSASAFLWEWFTTKPSVDAGEVRFIGSVPTPWPSWHIAAHTSKQRAPTDAVIDFVATLSSYVRDFDSQESRRTKDVEYIRKNFGYPEEDINEWLKTVSYPRDCTAIDGSVIQKTLDTLKTTGVITRPPEGFIIEEFTNKEAVRLV
ncbi:hypothetical protein FRC02_001359 [Tulasnella sp. 418]|nr:hypothetical protein FRC02_001359 [Tulasnella sp. 418]